MVGSVSVVHQEHQVVVHQEHWQVGCCPRGTLPSVHNAQPHNRPNAHCTTAQEVTVHNDTFELSSAHSELSQNSSSCRAWQWRFTEVPTMSFKQQLFCKMSSRLERWPAWAIGKSGLFAKAEQLYFLCKSWTITFSLQKTEQLHFLCKKLNNYIFFAKVEQFSFSLQKLNNNIFFAKSWTITFKFSLQKLNSSTFWGVA